MKYTTRLVCLAGLVASAGAVFGFAVWRLEVGRLEHRVSSLEGRNASLERVIDSWPAGVRQGRTPLLDRIRELETELAARDLAPDRAAPVPVAPVEELVGEALQEEAVVPEPIAARLPEALPPVSASPLSTGPADCSILIDPGFVLEIGEGDLARFGGRLRAALLAEESGSSLHVAGDDLSPYRADGFPMHVAWECDGLPYVISLCRADGRHVEGVISLAGFWDRPCESLEGASR